MVLRLKPDRKADTRAVGRCLAHFYSAVPKLFTQIGAWGPEQRMATQLDRGLVYVRDNARAYELFAVEAKEVLGGYDLKVRPYTENLETFGITAEQADKMAKDAVLAAQRL